MRRKLTLLTAIALAAIINAGITASTDAASLGIRPAGNTTMNSLGKITFEEGSGVVHVQCNINMSGSLHGGTIEKVAGTLLGWVTSARLLGETCTGGIGVTVAGLPWHISYESISGTLPSNVTAMSVLVRSFSFLLEASTIFGTPRCRYRGNLEATMTFTGSNPYTTGLMRLNESAVVPLEEQTLNTSIECPGRILAKGTIGLSPSQTITRDPVAEPTIEFAPAGEISLDSLHEISFTGGTDRMSCFWTLRGSLTRGAIRRVEGQSLGSISSTSHDHCSGGSVSAVLGTPWTIKYVSVVGTAPNEATAVRVKIEGYAVNLRTLGRHVGCLYRGALAGTLELSGANPYPTGLLRLEEPRLEFVSGEGGCPASITAAGRFWLDPGQEVRLVL